MNNSFDSTAYHNRYRNAAYYVDQQAEKVLSYLKKNDMLKDTVVIITSDHGEEFNDNHKNYWGHGSDFSPYQIHVPFIVHWPGKKAQVIKYKTSHFDVVPTLMSSVLGVKNPYSDYTVGHSLFENKPENLYVIGSYSATAFVTDHLITTIYPGGFLHTTDSTLNHTSKDIPSPWITKAIKQTSMFFKH